MKFVFVLLVLAVLVVSGCTEEGAGTGETRGESEAPIGGGIDCPDGPEPMECSPENLVAQFDESGCVIGWECRDTEPAEEPEGPKEEPVAEAGVTEDLKERELLADTSIDNINYLDRHGNDLFWSDEHEGSFFKVSVFGGEPVEISGVDSSPLEFLVSSGEIYFVNSWSDMDRNKLSGCIKKADLDGNIVWSSSKGVGSVENEYRGDIEEDTNYIYNAMYQAYTWSVLRVDKDTGEGEDLCTQSTAMWDIAFDGDYVYFTEWKTTSIKRVPKDGGNVEVLYAGETVAAASGGRKIEVDNNNVYWFTGNGAVYSMPKTGGVRTRIYSDPGLMFDIKVKGDYVYTLSSDSFGDNGRIVRIKKDGSEAAILFKGIEDHSQMVIDAGSIYFAEYDKVYKIET